MISAGQLNQRITIQRATSTPDDDTGQPIRTWANWKTRQPARVESVTGGEVIRGRSVSDETSTLFTIRYLAGVTTRDRVIYESRTLGIVHAGDPYGDRRELRIECREAE